MKRLLCSLFVLCYPVYAGEIDLVITLTKLASYDPYRLVGEQLHDLSSLFSYATNYVKWKTETRPAPKWKFLYGTITAVKSDGLIVELKPLHYWTEDYKGTIFLKNHPGNHAVVDGDPIAEFAVEAGRYQYSTPIGAMKTVVLYDFGTIPNAQQIADAENRKRELTSRVNALQGEIQEIDARKRKEEAQATLAKVIQFRKSQATNGIGYAQFDLGLQYLRGTDGLDRNHNLALFWLTRAATNGYPDALSNLSNLPDTAAAKK